MGVLKNIMGLFQKGSRLENPAAVKWAQALAGLGVAVVAPALMVIESTTGVTVTPEQAGTFIGMLANPPASMFGWFMFAATVATTNKIGIGTKK